MVWLFTAVTKSSKDDLGICTEEAAHWAEFWEGVKDTFGESGTPAELLKKYGLTAEDIVNSVKEAIAKK